VSIGQVVTEPSAGSPPESDDSLDPCLSCGAQAMDAYCAVCGERRRAETDYSLRRFVAHAFQTVTNVDSRVGRSFANLFLWPGHLASEHFAGRRRPYLDPLQLFLISNVVFFAIVSIGSGGPFTTTLNDQLRHHPYSPLLHGVATGTGTTFGELLEDPAALERYADTYDTVTATLAKTLIVLMIPAWALVSWLLFGRSARFFAQHLVFALHFWAYLLLLFCLVGLAMPAVQQTLAGLGFHRPWHFWDGVLSALLAVLCSVYLAEAGRRAFNQPLRWTIPKVMLLVAVVLPITFAYRFVLFFATLAAM